MTGNPVFRLFLLGVLAGLLISTCGSVIAQNQEDQEDVGALEKEIRKTIVEGELDAAIEKLDAAVKQFSENEEDLARLQRIRMTIGMGFLSKRDNDGAAEQFRSAVEYYMANLDNRLNHSTLTSALSTLTSLYQRTGKANEAYELVQEAVDRFRKMEKEGEVTSVSQNIGRLLAVQNRLANSPEKKKKIVDAINNELDRISKFHDQNPTHEHGILAMSSLLSTAVIANRANQEITNKLREQQEAILSTAVANNPKSLSIALAYGNAMASHIASTCRDEPEAAQFKLDQAVAILTLSNEELDDRLDSTIDRIKGYESRIEAALKVKAMIGKPAPEMDIDGWINTDADLSVDSLKGKVVLLDFWAVWCGPCVATFPHLKEWRDEYKDQGFEIVGVTRYYNYKWDEETEKAVRVAKDKQEIEADQERNAVGKFMQSHDLKHPSIVVPDGSKMQSLFGVTGIPHAVLIDRKGNVRMVKVGSGPANAKALHDMINKLLAED